MIAGAKGGRLSDRRRDPFQSNPVFVRRGPRQEVMGTRIGEWVCSVVGEIRQIHPCFDGNM